MPTNPYLRSGKRVAPDGTQRRMDEHRWVMEKHLGRRLPRSVHVHHINGDKRDNRLENLEVVSAHVHGLMHAPPIHPVVKSCVICGTEYRPHKTKRKRQQTCSTTCKRVLIGRKQKLRLTVEQRAEVCARYDAGEKQADIARRFGVSQTLVLYIRKHRPAVAIRDYLEAPDVP